MVKKSKKTTKQGKPNRLINEKSPYLLQHAYNPVDWYPWGDEAFEKAKAEDKPIFLSIGYSTCHWCHVMEHESFEDPEVAKAMNNSFVSIKVDREERPDIDNIYSGGWPLSIVMTPEKRPFFAGTYLPKESRFKQIGMLELAQVMNQLWKNRRNEVLDSASKIYLALKEAKTVTGQDELDEEILEIAFQFLERRFDSEFGGFGAAPKFPTPHNLIFLLRYWHRTRNKKALKMVETTLDNLSMGGIYDHLGCGFHRYSTDSAWLVPHFEKMLYDQALLAIAFIEAYQATGKDEYKQMADEIFTYVSRDMTSPEGGFYSAEDADSEGVEGKFYTWSIKELEKILNPKDAKLINRYFNVRTSGNFLEPLTGKTNGENILHQKSTVNEIAKELKVSEKQLTKDIRRIKKELFKHRSKRVRPNKDDKILADWNGLMIAALAKGGQVIGNPEYTKLAKRAVEFIQNNLRDKAGRLLHRFREGEAAILAHINDYAYLTWGLIELYETTFDSQYLAFAEELNNELYDHFWDQEHGGFYYNADDGEKLLLHVKEIYDSALPAGNSVHFLNLQRLGRFTRASELEERAAQMSRTFSKVIEQNPMAHTQFLVGLDFALGPTNEVLIYGNPKSDETHQMMRALRTHFIPNKTVQLNPTLPKSSLSTLIPNPVPGPKNGVASGAGDEIPKAYVCVNYSCQKPTSNIEEMLDLLGVNNKRI
jgi:uncharacterized protein YyaL (SSP411 family)